MCICTDNPRYVYVCMKCVHKNIIGMYVFRADHLVLDHHHLCSSLGKINSSTQRPLVACSSFRGAEASRAFSSPLYHFCCCFFLYSSYFGGHVVNILWV